LPRRGLAQILALIVILAVDRIVSPQFFDLRLQDGRLFGSLIDVLNRGTPVALLSLGMVLVIATRGIDLSVGAVMAISGAIAASLADTHSLAVVLAARARRRPDLRIVERIFSSRCSACSRSWRR
jgi:simple sugar transport system permease protein